MSATEILNPRDRLRFPALFRSLMTACEVNGEAGNHGAAAFEIESRHMLSWLERHGLEEARAVGHFLDRLILRLRKQPAGTVWSDEFDFNHRWTVAEARVFFESWSMALNQAMMQADAKSIVFLSLLQRARLTARLGRNLLGEYFRVPLSEREFAILEAGDAIEEGGKWFCISNRKRKNGDPVAIVWWISFFCGNCRRSLEVTRDPEDVNDLWRLHCCDAETRARSVHLLAQRWLGVIQSQRVTFQNA